MEDVVRAAKEVLGDCGGSVLLTRARNCGAGVRAG
jgi:beta-ribofuranosylaminobenzene 5'-phosphate synthase